MDNIHWHRSIFINKMLHIIYVSCFVIFCVMQGCMHSCTFHDLFFNLCLAGAAANDPDLLPKGTEFKKV